MIVKIKLTNSKTLKLIKFEFEKFKEETKKIVDRNLLNLAIKIFNIINVFGPKVVALE